MRLISLFAATAIASAGIAQSPLRTLSTLGNEGNVGGGIYFDLTVNTTVTFNRINWYCGATNTVAGTGTLDVYVGPTTYFGNVTNPALWTRVASITATVAPGAMSIGTLSTPFALGPGNYGIALASNAFNHGYTNGVTCSSTTIPGSCSNSLFSTAELTVRAGAAQNAFLSGGIFNPRIWNGELHYTPGGNPLAVASWENFGRGCNANYRSWYQHFPNPGSINVGTGNPIQAIKMTFMGSHYNVAASNGTVVAPTSAPVTLASGNSTFLATTALGGPLMGGGLVHTLNGAVAIASNLEISTDGYIVPSPATMANDNTPTPAEFLANAPRWAPHWKNMDPFAGGSMHVEYGTVTPPGQPFPPLLVTWNAVNDETFTTTSTFQVAFFANGDVEYRYGAMSVNGGGGWPLIIGYSNGNNSLDPGNIDLPVELPFSTETVDTNPLSMAMSARPLLNTTPNILVGAIPSNTTVGALIFGLTRIEFPLDVIGMPRCFLLQSADMGDVVVPLSTPQSALPLFIPVNTALNGALIFAQSVALSAGANQLGALSSGGLRIQLGSL